MTIRLFGPAACGLLAAAALTGAAPPASAQDFEEDIIVRGEWGRVPSDVESLSQRVSYADLDLSYSDDRRELRRRVSLTARYLCERLGETESSSSLAPSCREAATRDAMRRVGTVRARWTPRDTAWVEPARWEAPYPADWESTYPAEADEDYP